MSRFRECEFCGASLDPGEKCDCKYNEEASKPKASPKRAEEKAKRIQQDKAIAVFLFGGKIRRRNR